MHLPALRRPRLRRDDPSSWTGPFTESEINKDSADARSGYRWAARSIGQDPVLLELLPQNPAVLAIVDQLLGQGRYDPSKSTRGVYCTLPHPAGDERRSDRPKIHVDWAHGDRNRLGAIAYINDVEPGAGGFGVWPGTHLRVNNLLFDSSFASKISKAREVAGMPDQPQTRPRRDASDDGVTVPGLPSRVWMPYPPTSSSPGRPNNHKHDVTLSVLAQGVDPGGGVRAATWYSEPCVEALEKASAEQAIDCHGEEGTCDKNWPVLVASHFDMNKTSAWYSSNQWFCNTRRVVFYHASLAHTAGENHGTTIRQGVLTGWGVSEAAMPEDSKLEHVHRNDLWLDWSDQVRAVKCEAPTPRPPQLDQETRQFRL